jgi:hypothetical protein
MKYLAIVSQLLFAFLSQAQDTIRLRSNSQIIGLVREIDSDFVTYSMPNQDSIYVQVSKSDVQNIRYANGSIDAFSSETTNAYETEAYLRGIDDAGQYYNTGPDFTKGVVDGVLTYIMYAGVVMVIIDYRKEPKIDYPRGAGFEDEPSKNADYRKGYVEAAHKLKKRKLIGGFFTGLISFPIVLTGVILGTVASEM